MTRKKKSMTGFDPLAWLDEEGGGSSTSAEVGKKIRDDSLNTLAATSEVVGASDASSDSRYKPGSKKKQPAKKMITVLGLNLDETALLKGYKLVTGVLDEAIVDFYACLFKQCPDVKKLFKDVGVKAQAAKLSAALKILVEHLYDDKALRTTLLQMGELHQVYGALPEHYPVVTELLVASFKNKVGRSWTKSIDAAWIELLGVAGETMCAGYQLLPVDQAEKIAIDIKSDTAGRHSDASGESFISVLHLQAVQDISKSLALKNEILALVNDHDEIEIQASDVKRIDGTALQLLCALFKYANHNNLIIHWIRPTDELIESAQTLGMQEILELN